MSLSYCRLGLLIGLLAHAVGGYAQACIQAVTANGKALPYRANQPIRLAALVNDVTFTFSTGPGISYQYKLEGFDQHWNSSPYPVAHYTNLTGAEYALNVRYLQNGRVTASIQVPVSVERELVEEWWFIPSVIVYIGLLLGAVIYFFLLYNFRQQLKMQAIRYRIAADLHDEVGATLSSIAISTKLAQKKIGDALPDVQPILDTIKADAEETMYTIRDTIWTINPDNDSLEKLFEKMRSFAAQLLTAQGIALQYDNQMLFDKSPTISMEQRRNVYLMVKEAITNIANHSQATKVAVHISRTAEGIDLLITDNGVGFDPSIDYEGNGLKNFRSRAKASFITLTIQSKVGQGTQVAMSVPEL